MQGRRWGREGKSFRLSDFFFLLSPSFTPLLGGLAVLCNLQFPVMPCIIFILFFWFEITQRTSIKTHLLFGASPVVESQIEINDCARVGYAWVWVPVGTLELTLKLLGLGHENTDQLCENNVLGSFPDPQQTDLASMDSSEIQIDGPVGERNWDWHGSIHLGWDGLSRRSAKWAKHKVKVAR